MSSGTDIKVGITLTGDGSGLRGEVKVNAAEFDKLKGAAKGAGESAAGSFRKMSAAQADYSRKSSAYNSLQIRSNREIRREIAQVQAAHKRLATTGSLSAGELSRAHAATRRRVSELKREMAGLPAAGAGYSGLTSRVYALAGAWLSVGSAIKAIGSSDTFISVNARLLNATRSAEEYGIAQREVAAIARETRSDWAATIDLYSRLSRATQDLDVKQSDLLLVTKALNQASIVSGATTIEQTNAMIQLGQGLASGTLRGDELRSVLEQVPRVARMISDGMGIAFGDLRKLAEDGKITTEEIVRAIVKESATVQAEFNRMPPTVSQAIGQIRNEFTKLIGDQATASGGANALASALLDVADNVKEIPRWLPEIAFGLAAVSTQFVYGKVAAAGFAASVVSAKVAVAGLLRTMIPLASAFAVFEAVKTGIEAYGAKQDAAAASTRNTATAVKIFKEKLVPARKELRKLGVDLNKIQPGNIEQVTLALIKLNRARQGSVAANDEPGEKPRPKVAPLDPKLVAKSLKNAQSMTAQLDQAFDDTFTRTTTKYVSTWQELVRTHGAGSAQVKTLESAYQSWLDSAWEQQEAKDAERSQKKADREKKRVDNVIQLQTEKYVRLNQSAAEAMASDEDRALIKLDADLLKMEEERQRLTDQHIWTEELETAYDQARIDRAQITAAQLGQIHDREVQHEINLKKRASQQLVSIEAHKVQTIFGIASAMVPMITQNAKAQAVIQGALSAAEVFMNYQVASARALAELGPIAGAPVAAALQGSMAASMTAIAAKTALSFSGAGGSPATPTYSVNPGTGLPSQPSGPSLATGSSQPQQQKQDINVYVMVSGATTLEEIKQQAAAQAIDTLGDEITNNHRIVIHPNSANAQLIRENA